jgi:hypothetical protein
MSLGVVLTGDLGDREQCRGAGDDDLLVALLGITSDKGREGQQNA